MEPEELNEEENRMAALRIREALARRRISRQRLADEAGVGLSTLEKALSGSRTFTLSTLVRLEGVLQISLRAAACASEAPASIGGYGRASVEWLSGAYLTLRPSFEQAHAVYAYLTEIWWDETQARLLFQETNRLDAPFSQKGEVSLPHQSGQIYFVTNDRGQYRLITLARPTITGEMFGLLSTLHAGRGGRLSPIAAPIALIRCESPNTASFGLIDPTHRDYIHYRGCLDRTLREEFARILSS
ncbi:helix-turn-helix transcriptional regulator [Caulobacter sp. S45]|uniref:helix-turn-helix domain-containing protein n=1 Tax=Caulobacter sp. S45 TaxID=1641861 RepID=UPI00131DCF8F|nr:helix-turn-helix transcriptional regulator [Caulobacter sp. S45]